MRQKGFVISILLFNLMVPLTYAESGLDYTVEVSQKLGRGTLNVLSSPLEIPCTIGDEIKDRGAIGALTGLFGGVVFMARRLLVGTTEMMTFMIPMEETLPPVCTKKAPAKIE